MIKRFLIFPDRFIQIYGPSKRTQDVLEDVNVDLARKGDIHRVIKKVF